jgi:dihydroorotate dehydrogenase (fumarate)
MADLKTTYMGLELSSPIIVSSSPHTSSPQKIKDAAEAGAAAVVVKSIFEEQIRGEIKGMEQELEDAMENQWAAYEYLRSNFAMDMGTGPYLDQLADMRRAVDIPVIASMNCISPDQWVTFGSKIETTGVDAIELNVYDIPDHPDMDATTVEQRHLDLIAAVSREVKIPVAVKLSPFYTSVLNLATRIDKLDVQGLVLFNRFFQPDIDVDSLALKSAPNLSHADDIRLPLRWTAILSGRVTSDVALTGGVHDAEGAIKAMLAGATVAQICSTLSINGLSQLRTIIDGMAHWMDERGFATVDAFRGKLREEDLEDRHGFERVHYIKALTAVH